MSIICYYTAIFQGFLTTVFAKANTSKGGRTASDRQEHKGGSIFSPFVTFVLLYWVGISLAGKTFCDLCEKFFLRAE